ncbi:hypothetical protein HDU83_004841 [Entophlyctis luteolus]|nr:hypothetical protein HDU83_004841 [Entophlyctis luteolus]
MVSNWLLCVLADSALPTGGFVASAGLEAFVTLYGARNLSMIRAFIESNIATFAASAVPFLSQAYKSVSGADNETVIETIMELDHAYDCMLVSNAISHRASTAQGSSFASLTDNLGLSSNLIKALKKKIRVSSFEEFVLKSNALS